MSILANLQPLTVLSLMLISAVLASATTAAALLLRPTSTSEVTPPTANTQQAPDLTEVRAILEPLGETAERCLKLAKQKGSKEYAWRIQFLRMVGDHIKTGNTGQLLFIAREIMHYLEDWQVGALARMPDVSK
jgi:hypothetical protein